MAGQGKYTTYVPVASERNTRLGRLFRGNSTIENPFAAVIESGDQEKAVQLVVEGQGGLLEGAEALLRPTNQQGDPGHFPEGVNMNYTGNENDITNPNLPDVAWSKAGDPANPYMPNPTSPGPGETSPLAQDEDPGISPTDVKGQGYVPGQPGVSTARNPAETSSPIREANRLGRSQPLGKNSTNEPSGF